MSALISPLYSSFIIRENGEKPMPSQFFFRIGGAWRRARIISPQMGIAYAY
jgi:hypothetical protein